MKKSKKVHFFLCFFLILSIFSFTSYKKIADTPGANQTGNNAEQSINVRLNASEAFINTITAEVIDDNRLSAKKGVAIKAGVDAAIDGERSEPDLVFEVKVPAGRYVMYTYAVTDEEGAELMKNAKSKFESMYMRIQIDESRPTKRVVYVPWDRPRQESGKFEFSGEGSLKLWLPRGVRLEYVQLVTYSPPKVPGNVQNYEPVIVPPSTHPRLWLTKEQIPVIKSRLEEDENKNAWKKVKALALAPFEFEYNTEEEISYQPSLERAAESKAFYYLMTGDVNIGREAIELMSAYLSVVEFGNLLDITRERGRAIYYGALVFDWCYDLLTPEEKKSMSGDLLRQADDMEIGWPPFKQSILTGHGNEAQVNRDLLSMSIAIYDENPEPYKYCSYRILEELVPMRNWQYQSPRHNQGINYGAYRSVWDMHAAWFFYRMTGSPVFDDNIKNLPQYWLYMRLPDGQMLRDGDGFNAGAPGEFYYWKHPYSTLLFYTYSADPLLKAEFKRQGQLSGEPILYLLLNDPSIKPVEEFDSLPLTKDFGPVLGSMIARTGWHIGMESNDVVAEVKGGGYHFGNHQHSDAGALQIYYRGFQAGDLGLYGFYGTPYDMNFNKRSVSHSMLLVRDPEEKYLNTESNDGGTRLNQRHPDSPEIAQTDEWFNNGTVVSADFGPSERKPAFSYFSVDLKGAYSSKIEAYTRSFCFLNLEMDSIPAAIILTDDVVSANADFKKYWQINTHNPPEITGTGVVLSNRRKGLVGNAHVNMLLPRPENRTLEVLGGEDANSSFEYKYEVPSRINHLNYPEADGHRILISPKAAGKQHRFLTVFQMTAGQTQPLPVSYTETEDYYLVYMAGSIVGMNKGILTSSGIKVNVRDKNEHQVVLTGIKEGTWNIRSRNNKTNFNTAVSEGKNTIFFKAGKGEYTVSPL